MIRIDADRDLRKVNADWQDRQRQLGDYITVQAAIALRERLQSLVSGLPLAKVYARNATVRRVPGMGAVVEISARRKVRASDAGQIALYIAPIKARRGRKLTPVEVLQIHSPWTWDTLPFQPKRNVRIVSRRVSASEIRTIRRDRVNTRRAWDKQLREAGAGNYERIRSTAIMDTSVDLYFEVMRTEFGMGGAQVRAHWQPAVMDVRKVGIRSVLDSSTLRAVFADGDGWKKALGMPAGVGRASSGALSQYQAFQDKVRA